MSRPRALILLVVALISLALAAVGIDDGGRGRDVGRLTATRGSTGAGGFPDVVRLGDPEARPNVVVIVSDDLDDATLPYLPHVRALLTDQGASFDNFYVEQSSCCTSRASILSGLYAHNHGVIGNAWPQGGYDRWKATKEDTDLATWLHRAGYRDALLGKYMNEYPYYAGIPASTAQKQQLKAYVPPGWDDWAVPVQGNAYAQEHYRLNVDGRVDTDFHTGFLDSLLGDRLVSLVDGSNGFDFGQGGQFVYYASYSPHTPYAYPAQYDGAFDDVTYPRTPAFDEADVSDKFGLTRTRQPLTPEYIAKIDRTFRERVRSVQVLDDNVARLVAALKAQGALDNTYIIFTSDNGYIMGDHRREIGKYDQFQETVKVPFIVRGPGIAPGTVVHDVAGNIDIAPTVAAITGARPAYPTDGVSLLDRLHGGPALARKYFLLGRSLTPTNSKAEAPVDEAPEDYVEGSRSTRLNDFTGVVNGRFKLIRYTHIPHEELYDLERDPYELNNLLAHDQASFDALSPTAQGIVTSLRSELDRLVACAGASCQS